MRIDELIFRSIRPEEGEEAGRIEQICFPPHEACSMENMISRAQRISDTFLVAEDPISGSLAGFLNGIATNEEVFRDEFFRDPGLHDPEGTSVMLLGLDVLPAYRRQGLARKLMEQFAAREKQKGRTRLVLTCLEEKVDMYKKFGFRDLGISGSSWGNEQWHEMDRIL